MTNKESIGDCESCNRSMFEGDLGHYCDDGPIFCEACAPTWNDMKRQHDEAFQGGFFLELFDNETERAAAARREVERRIAAGDGEKKHVWVL